MKRAILCFLSVLFSLIAMSTSAYAQLDSYGYVVGTFVPNSNFVEPLDQQGKFLHYHFKVQIQNGTQYECVIDIKRGHIYEFPYRIVNMRHYNASYYGDIFSATNAYHPITMTSTGGTASQGALDYIRHPGILRDIAGRKWRYVSATPTSNPNQYTLPEFDDLFANVQKIYVFGSPYSSGYGMHVIHQNQGDQNASYIHSNGTFQDGAVIFEYAPTSSGKPVRKLLMVKFDDQPNEPGQTDFTYTTDPDGTGPLHVGQAAPYYEENIHYSGLPTSTEGYTTSKLHGPYDAEQIEIFISHNEDDCMSYNDVDVFLGNASSVTNTSNYSAYSMQRGCIDEFVRSYGQDDYYFFVNPFWNNSLITIQLRYR